MAGRSKRDRSRGSAGNNRKSGEEFLEKNKKKDGVIETSSGLQYLVLEEGDGDKPDKKAIITVNRTGKSGDGMIFVMPCQEAVRVRTGERGEDTLDDG